MLSGERLLIVEEEFLIAMDIQRVVEDANAAQTVFARNYKELAALEPRFGEFDLAIVTPPRPGTREGPLLDRLVQAGAALVVCSATHAASPAGNLPFAQIVTKPFADDELLQACLRALKTRKHS